MAKHATYKRTTEGKRVTLERREIRRHKYGTARVIAKGATR